MLRAQCTNARSVTSVWGFMQSACVCHHVQFVDDVVPYARERSIEFPNRLTSASTYLCDLHPLDLPSTPADRRKSRYWHWRGGNKWRIDRRQGVSRDRVTLKVPITGCNECISSGDKNARKKIVSRTADKFHSKHNIIIDDCRCFNHVTQKQTNLILLFSFFFSFYYF